MYLGQAFPIPENYESYQEKMGLFALGIGDINAEINNFYSIKLGDSPPWLERQTMGEILLPLYQKLIAAGEYPPFEYHEFKRTGIAPTQAVNLARHLEQETGFNYQFIWNYLTCLESLAKGGAIDFKHYDPETKDLKTITEPHILDNIKNAVPTIFKAAPAAAMKIQKNIIIIGALGLGAYVLFTANKFIKR